MTLPCMDWLHNWVQTEGGAYCTHCGSVCPHTYTTDSVSGSERRADVTPTAGGDGDNNEGKS